MRSQHISPRSFERFGRVASLPGTEPLAEDDTFSYWSDVASYEIDGATEVGFCRVYRRRPDHVDWMERHDRTPEILIPIDRAIVLPVMGRDRRVEAFRIDIGQAVVIDRGVWHSACRPVGGEEATYFVVFRRGTPQEDVIKTEVEPVVIEPS